MHSTFYRISAVALTLIALVMVTAQGTGLQTDDQQDDELVQVLIGVEFGQVTDSHMTPTNSGLVSVDYRELDPLREELGGTAYLNVIELAAVTPHWIVQNVPLVPSAKLPGVGTIFDLGVQGRVNDLEIEAFVSPKSRPTPPRPQNLVKPGPVFPPRGKPGIQKKFVVPILLRAAGLIRGIPFPSGLAITPHDCPKVDNPPEDIKPVLLETKRQEGQMPNVEQNLNQCCPGALANSMQYLKGLGFVPKLKGKELENVKGLRGVPAKSLEGQIDLDMSRLAGVGTPPRAILCGKLNFLNRTGLGGVGLVLEHQGSFCQSPGFFCLPDRNIKLGDCFTGREGPESTFKGKLPTRDFLLEKIKAKADVEAAFIWQRTPQPPPIPPVPAGAHCVRIFGYERTQGIYYVWIMQDADQLHDGGVGMNDGGLLRACLEEKTVARATFLTMPHFGDEKAGAFVVAVFTNLTSEQPPAK